MIGLLEAMVEAQRWPISFSIGVASFTTPPESVERLIRYADALMYEVKHSGKAAIRAETY